MPSTPMIERLAVRKSGSVTFVLDDIPFLPLPKRFLDRYPEMVEWQDQAQQGWQRWRSNTETKIQQELDGLKSGK